MLRITGLGGLRNLGSLKIYNHSFEPSYDFINVVFGEIVSPGQAVYDNTLNITQDRELLISNPSYNGSALSSPSSENLLYYSGSYIPRPYIKFKTTGEYDSSYNQVAYSPVNASGVNGGIFNTFVSNFISQSDGKIIAFCSSYSNGNKRADRLNTDLSIDTTFKAGQFLRTNPSLTGIVNTGKQQSDGKIIVGGLFAKYSGSSYEGIVRMNSDGTVDSSFNPKDGFDSGSGGALYSIDIQNDGKIVVGGNFNGYYSGSGGIYARTGSVRINPDGTLDQDFKNGTGSNAPVYAVKIQSDGKILLGGTFTTYSGSSVNRLIRVDASGALDPTFKTGSGFNYAGSTYGVYDIKILSDSKILVAGLFSSYSGSSSQGIIKLNTDGTVDTSFKTGGGVSASAGLNNTAYVTNVLEDAATGKIYIQGYFLNYSGSTDYRYIRGLMRLNSDGSVDESFSTNPAFYSQYSGQYGTPDPISIVPTRIKKQSDGKYVVFTKYGSYIASPSFALKNLYSGVFRYNSDFTFDQTFNPGKGTLSGPPEYFRMGGSVDQCDIAIQSDNKIILAGGLQRYSGSNSNYIVRINTDGTKDDTYITGSAFNSDVYTIALQSDNKAVVGGAFTIYSGSRTNRIARINTDGTKDNTFITGSGFDNTVYKVVTQTDGKIIVGGQFTNYSASTVSCTGSVRINSDGTVDTSFNVGSGFRYLGGAGAVTCIVSQSDGKIMVAGKFDTYNGTTIGGIVRLNSDASIDTSFNSGGSGFTINVSNICYPINMIQKSDGSYLLAMYRRPVDSVIYNGVTLSSLTTCIIGLNSNGSYRFHVRNNNPDANVGICDFMELENNNFLAVGQFSFATGSYSDSYATSPEAFQTAVVKFNENGRLSQSYK